MEILGLIILFVILLLVILLLVWLYTKYKTNNTTSYNITKLIEGQQDATQYVMVNKSKIPLSVQGNEYSISFWVFIKDYNYRYGSKKAVLYRGDKENNNSNPYIYFDAKNNDLTVRVELQSGTGSRSAKSKNNRKSKKTTNENFMPLDYFNPTGAMFMDNLLKSNVSGNLLSDEVVEHFAVTPSQTTGSQPATIGDINNRLDRIELQIKKIAIKQDPTPTPRHSEYDSNNNNNNQGIMYDECKIENIPIQKWVHLVVSVYNNNIEIYMDGKLNKTCSLSGFPKPNIYNMHVTPNGGFNGFIAQLDYSNAALPVDKIYDIYSKGPKINKSLMDSVKNFGSGFSNALTE
jgi:hypothetical protein